MSAGVMRRLRAPVLAAVWAAAVGSVAVGGGGMMAAVLLATATAVTAAALATRQRGRGRGGTESSWSAPGEPVAAVPVAAVPVAVAPVIGGTDRRSRWAAARPIGRFEARELATNPWFGAGVGICVLVLVAVATIADPEPTDLADAAAVAPFLAHPLVGLTIVAAHRNATRSQRDDTSELVEACPAGDGVRTAGFLRTCWVPVVALGAFFAGHLAVVGATSPRAGGSGGSGEAVALAASHIVAGLLLGAGGVALGTALARWARHSLVPIVAVVAVGFVSLRLGDGATGEYRPRMLLSTFGPLPDDVVLTTTQAWVHVAWLAAISAATAIVAVVARRRA